MKPLSTENQNDRSGPGFRTHYHRLRTAVQSWLQSLRQNIRVIGASAGINNPEGNKLGIFSLLNFFQLLTGLLLPLAGIFFVPAFPLKVWLITCLPALISAAVLILNTKGLYRLALLVYFVCYPVFTCIVYINGINPGIELWFILYGIFAVFFIRDTDAMLIAISFSMISYFILSVAWKSYPYQLEEVNKPLYLLYQGLAIVYIFYGLYLIKTENNTQQAALKHTNQQIQEQAAELEQLNAVKNKMFSIISHDLKAPLYALRNLFDHVLEQNMHPEDIKSLLPEIKNDLHYTTGLMENLLQWARSQMNAYMVRPQSFGVHQLSNDVMQVLARQAQDKQVQLVNETAVDQQAYADADMISVVMRNLISNAIKFTPEQGMVTVGSRQHEDSVEIYVQDTGKGMSREEIAKIEALEFYTTQGTRQEQGTGLGLWLCKEFLIKNKGSLYLESEPGKGSIISFKLPAR